MKINISNKIIPFSYFIFLICLSCSNNNKNTKLKSSENKINIENQISKKLNNPIITLIDTCKPPQKISLPLSNANLFNTLKSGEKIKLKPAKYKSADFLSQMQNYTTDNGLALDAIASAIMDKKGNLWFGTYGGGVSRYDGKSFTNFTTAHGLSNNFVYSIIEDKKGNIWFGTSGGGVSKYDGITFKNFTTKQGLVNDIVRIITEDKKGNIWIGTNGGGVSKYDGVRFKNYTIKNGLASNIVRSIAEDKEGNIWFGTDGSGVSIFDGEKFKNYTTKQGLAFDDVKSILVDNKGLIWLGTSGNGISCFNGKTFKNYSTKDGLANNTISCITQDKKGNIWFGTQDGGVSCFDGKKFENYTSNQGLINNIVRSITEDRSGNIWFGTQGGGLSRYDGKSFTNFTTNQGLSNNIILSIKEDNIGNIWYGTFGGGVLKYNGKTFENFTTAQGLPNDVVYCITKDKKDNLWFGTNGGGVSKFDGKSFTNFTTDQGLSNNVVINCTEDKSGNLWFGTLGSGVSKFDGRYFTNYTTDQGLAFNVILCSKVDKKGNIWFGTNGGGVSKYDGKKFINFTTKEGLANDIILCITEDSYGNIWFGTDGGGVSRYDGKTFLNLSKTQGLPDNTISQVVIDNKNNIFLGSNYGVAVAKHFELKNSSKKITIQNNLTSTHLKKYTPFFEVYNSSTGYPVKDVNAGQNAMYKDKNGIIWIATGADKTALVRFNYDALNVNKKKPSLFIHSVKINNESIWWYNLSKSNSIKIKKTRNDSTIVNPQILEEVLTEGRVLSDEERQTMKAKFNEVRFNGITKFYSLPKNLILPHKQGNITFEFAAVEPAKPYLVRYQYKLEGYDDEWSPITNENTATFGNIFEGNYTFKLKAQNPNGIWSDPIEYKFKVLPPWWRTWWMYTTYIILAIFIVAFIVWINGRRLRSRALELTMEIRKATSIIVDQKKVVETQKLIVEKKNRDITDSINYAVRIQHAFLPKKDAILNSFPESFILFKPKDIVSGDFYYYHKNEETVIIAAADCTGHGVPGAFMSMVGSERLTDAVQQSNKTNEILTLLNLGVKKSLHQTDKEDSTRDGMDIAICSIDIQKRIINYSGANRPIWIVRNGKSEIEEIKATKVAIGGLTPDSQQFETHEIKLEKGDSFYIFTDGYGDLFSDTGKKLKTKYLKEIILEIQDKSMPEQEDYLNEFAEKWKNGSEQIDDILFIGIRI